MSFENNVTCVLQVSLVVNVASKCGYTDQHYKGLVRLQNELVHTDRFTVLAFPCNQFGSQEPGVSIFIGFWLWVDNNTKH